MKKILFVFVAMILMISCNSQKKGITIGICQIANDEVLDLARQNVIKALKDAGYEDGKNMTIDYKNAQGEITNIMLILKEFKSKKVDLIITNGTPCMASAAQIIKDIPVVYTVAFSPEQLGINNPPSNLCGLYDGFNMNELIALVKEAIPGITTIGQAYNPAEPNAAYAAKKVKEATDKAGLKLIQSTVTNSNDIMQTVQSLCSKNIQALVFAADNMLYSGISNVINISNEKKVPIFVTDPQQSEKGAMFGYGVNYSDWGYESGKIAAQVLKGKKPSEFGNQPLMKLNTIFNSKTAALQGYNIPEELKKKVNNIIK